MDLQPEMTCVALVELLRLLERAGIRVWLDGGWGVDALLHRQSRKHKDVDVVLALSDAHRLQNVLAREGFAFKEGQLPNSFVLANGAGLEVDVHAVAFDPHGNGVYRMQNGEDWVYPSEGFMGRGSVGGISVRCLSPAAQVLCHAHGYTPTEKDKIDMGLLAESFGVELPRHLQHRKPSKID